MRTLAVACLALTALAAGCGDDEPERVDGTGYAYAVPDGWRDATDEVEDEPELSGVARLADTVVAGERDDGFTVNLNVIRARGVPAGMSSAEFAELSISTLRDPVGAGLPPEVVESVRRLQPGKVSEPRAITLGGEPAAIWSYTGSAEGHLLIFRQVGAVMDGRAYTLTLSALPAQLGEGLAALDEIRDSWQWD